MLLGAQVPQYQCAPPGAFAGAAEAIDLMAFLRQPLDPWQRLTLELGLRQRADANWAAFEVACFVQRQNGKGAITEARELAGLFLFGERLIIHTAHLVDTAKTAFRRVMDLIDGSDELTRRVKRVVKSQGEQAVELMTGAELQFRTRSTGSGRGFSCDCLIIDEALYLKQIHADALLPTMLARPNPQVWYTSTPPETVDAHIVKVRKDGHAGADNLVLLEWSSPRGADLADPAVLAAANPAWGIRLNAGVMESLRRRLGEEGFARECGGIWPPEPDAEWQVITEAAWTARADPHAVMAGPRALVVDVVPDRSAAAVNSAGAREGGGRMVAVVAAAPGVGWVLPMLQALVAERTPAVLVINDKAVADAAETAGLAVYRPSGADMVSACTGFYDGVAGEAADIWHLGQPELTDAVAGAVKRMLGGGKEWAWDRRLVAVNIAPLVGATLAAWAASTPRVHQVHRAPAVAGVDLSRPVKRAAPPDQTHDVASARLREQIERDLAGSGMR